MEKCHVGWKNVMWDNQMYKQLVTVNYTFVTMIYIYRFTQYDNNLIIMIILFSCTKHEFTNMDIRMPVFPYVGATPRRVTILCSWYFHYG